MLVCAWCDGLVDECSKRARVRVQAVDLHDAADAGPIRPGDVTDARGGWPRAVGKVAARRRCRPADTAGSGRREVQEGWACCG